MSSMDHHLICPNSLPDKLGCIPIPTIIKRTNSIDSAGDKVKEKVNRLKTLSNQAQDDMKNFITKFDEVNRSFCAVLSASKTHSAYRELKTKIQTMLKEIKEISHTEDHFGPDSVDKPGIKLKTEQELSEDNENFISDSRASIVTDMLRTNGTELAGASSSTPVEPSKLAQRRIISIVGPGGCGKTAVAYNVYSSKEIKCHFKVRMWVTISEEYEPIDLLKKMLSDIRRISDEEKNHEELNFLTSKLQKELQNKRYLLVLDDVWSNTLWNEIVVALPDNDNGSRVLLTTRIATIAEEADPERMQYKLPLFKQEESEKILRNIYKKECKSLRKESTDLSDELVAKWVPRCDGLPLALKVLGRVLAEKNPDREIEWEMDWAVDGKECLDSLQRSYEDLRVELKPCFLYLACFPMDYKIDAKVLIQLWIAEEIVEQEGGTEPESIAQQWLNELAERFIVKVDSRPYDKSVNTVRILHLLHHLAIAIAKKYNFVTVVNGTTTENLQHGSENTFKRLALDYTGMCDNLDQFMKKAGPNLLSIHRFDVAQPGSNDFNTLPDNSDYTKLKVLNVEDVKINDTMDWNRLNRLRFLRAVNKSGIPQNLSSIMRQVNHLSELQTLDLRTYDHELDGCSVKHLWDIVTLRYVCFPPGNKVLGPPKKAHLPHLQTLKYVHDSISGHMPNVLHLKLWVRDSSLVKIASLLKKLEKLISLRLDLGLAPQDVSLSKCFLDFKSFKSLRNMYLTGVRQVNFSYKNSLFPTKLYKLRLSYSNLEQDPMPELGKLPKLKILIMHAAFDGEKMTCSAGGFPSLEELTLTNLPNLKELEVQNGALPALKLLKMDLCPKLISEPKNLTSTCLQIHKGW